MSSENSQQTTIRQSDAFRELQRFLQQTELSPEDQSLLLEHVRENPARVAATFNIPLPFAHPSQKVRREEPISRAEYRRECLRRSPELMNDLLRFNQNYPPVLVKTTGGLSAQHTMKLAQRFGLPFTMKSAAVLIGAAKANKDLPALSGIHLDFLAAQVEWRILLPVDGSRYFKSLGRSQREWRDARQVFRKRWPEVAGDILDGGRLEDADRPWLLVPAFPFDQDQWEETVSTVAASARMMVPIYPSTVEKDLDWTVINRWKRKAYKSAAAQRTRDNILSVRLRVWDLYQELRSFPKVKRLTSLPLTNVKRHYLCAARDILGAVPTGSVKERRLLGFNPETHTTDCSRCRTGNSLCPAAEAYANKDSEPLREILGSKDTIGYSVNQPT